MCFFPETSGSELDEEEIECEDSDSDESWTTESAISSETILSSMCLNGDDEKPFACPVPGCKKRYKVCIVSSQQAVLEDVNKNALKQKVVHFCLHCLTTKRQQDQ